MELYKISDVQKAQIYKSNGVNKESLAEDVKLIEEWIKKQAHLPEKFQHEFFPLRMLIANKFSVERAKERIEKYYTLKRRYQEFFTVFDSDEFVDPSKSTVTVVPLPKLGPQNERIMFMFVRSPDPKLYEIKHFFQWFVAALEMMNMYDRTTSVRIICDVKNYTFEHLKKLDINGCLRVGQLAIKGYGLPMVSFDYINVHPSVNFIISFTQKMLSSKLLQRFQIHDNLESLYTSIPRDYLPEEYGGSAGKMSDAIEKMEGAIRKHRKVLAESAKFASDESLRIGETGLDYGDENFGVDGTFKQLNLF